MAKKKTEDELIDFTNKAINELQGEGKANFMRIGIISFFVFGSFSGYFLFSRYGLF